MRAKNGDLFCVRCPFINFRNARPTVTALILHKNKVLLARRNYNPFKDYWDLPGGFIDKGEHPEDAIKRELKEEMGMSVRIKKLFGVYTGTYLWNVDPCYILSVAYIVEPQGWYERIVDAKEVKDIKWFSKKELKRKKIAFDSNRKILKDFIKNWQ